jgi:Flp pilus assembly protein TadG
MNRHKMVPRRGSILPLLGVSLVALFGFVALAIDIGRLSVAKVQCQSAADAAAIAGARTIDGTGASSLSSATANAQSAALAHKILSQSIQAAEVTITHGTYHYDDATQKFVPLFTVTAPDCYNLTQVVIRHAVTPTFCGIFGRSLATVSTTATAAHRPRDVAIVLDYSGSMNNESDLWNNEGYLGSANNGPNNKDPVFPQWGPYKPAFSPNATLQCTSGDSRVGKCNITQAVLGIPAMVGDFYQNSFGGAA